MALTNLGTAAAGPSAALPMLALTGPAAVPEGNASGNSAGYTLTLARQGTTGPVNYSWQVAGSGASPASANDFAGGVYPSGSGTFLAGETSKTITVTFAGDTQFEPDEGFVVSVSASLSLGTVSATGIILNDDAAPPPVLLMGSRYNQPGFNGYEGSNGTDTNSNNRIGSYNETGATVTKLRAYFVNWWVSAATENNGYNAITVSSAVEYPAGTFTPLTFGGGASASIPATGAGSLAESDEATLATPIPAGALYWVRTYVSVAAGERWVQAYQRYTGYPEMGDACDFNTGVDKSAGGTIANVGQTGYPEKRAGYGPAAVKATGFTGTPVARAFAAVGDSLVMGATDAQENQTEGHGNAGYFAKACTGRYPVVNLGISGSPANTNLPANFTRRAALMARIGITHVFCDWSINDIIGNRTAAQLAGDVSSIAAGFKNAVPGVKVVWATLTPYTTSTDGWKTVANQTARTTPAGAFTGGASSARAQFNASLRAGIGGVDTVFEAADAVETARNSGIWRAGDGSTHLTSTGATSDAATSDGLHPTAFITGTPGYGGIAILRDAVRGVFAGW